VFTPYWRRWRICGLRPVVPAPRTVRLATGVEPGRIPAVEELCRSRTAPSLPRGGETAGRRRMTRWLTNGLTRYEPDANRLDRDATSRLSPYLHLGCVSPVELVARARRRQGGDAFVRALCWRDFFQQLLAANPDLPRSDLRPREREWRDDDEAFARWCEGETGVAVVDAGMRRLAHEGWLPNRARLIVSSYLTKTLELDWRLGERFFREHLVDGDVANNAGNWQWVAGTGTDTRPNRTLSMERQAARFDPDGAYVRRYVA
jgi:deoxyribodipyrimidine photo-lyase